VQIKKATSDTPYQAAGFSRISLTYFNAKSTTSTIAKKVMFFKNITWNGKTNLTSVLRWPFRNSRILVESKI
jgi:hypothetical protein